VEVLYSDKDLVVLDKPPGIAVHGGDKVAGETVADFLLGRFPEVRGVGEDPARPGIVHRLDKDTSGIMVVARNQKSFVALKELFQKRLIEKTYLAIVCGASGARQGAIEFPIGRLEKNPTKRGAAGGRARIRGAREARTAYRVLKSGGGYSLLELKPATGRMHQLRVHCAAIGRPMACDKKYGGKNVCCPAGASRQMLHAKSLSFSFPEGRKLYFEADPPADFTLAEKSIL